MWAEKTFGGVLFLLYTYQYNYVPFVAESMVSLPLSGLDAMAVFTTYVWDRLATWLDEGSPQNPPINIRNNTDDKDDRYNHIFFQSMKKFEIYAEDIQKITTPAHRFFQFVDESDLSQGVIFDATLAEVSVKIEHILCDMLATLVDVKFKGKLILPILRREDPRVIDIATRVQEYAYSVQPHGPQSQASPPAPTLIIDGTHSVGYLGKSVTSGDFDGDGRIDLVFSAYGEGVQAIAPQRGTVHINYGNGSVGNLTGDSKQSRFGWSVAVLDFNLDGVEDLVVAAPTASWEQDVAPLGFDTPPVYRYV